MDHGTKFRGTADQKAEGVDDSVMLTVPVDVSVEVHPLQRRYDLAHVEPSLLFRQGPFRDVPDPAEGVSWQQEDDQEEQQQRKQTKRATVLGVLERLSTALAIQA